MRGEWGSAGARDQRGKRDQPRRPGARTGARSAFSAQAAAGVPAGIHAVARRESLLESGRAGGKRSRRTLPLPARKVALYVQSVSRETLYGRKCTYISVVIWKGKKVHGARGRKWRVASP